MYKFPTGLFEWEHPEFIDSMQTKSGSDLL